MSETHVFAFNIAARDIVTDYGGILTPTGWRFPTQHHALRAKAELEATADDLGLSVTVTLAPLEYPVDET